MTDHAGLSDVLLAAANRGAHGAKKHFLLAVVAPLSVSIDHTASWCGPKAITPIICVFCRLTLYTTDS